MRNDVTTKILVVDDERPIQVLVREALQPFGYETNVAGDGQEGLKTFFTWRPALVVLDVLMPGMDGWQVLERIREVSEAPVIMLSALGQERQIVRGLRAGADDYVVKPFGTEELVARVEKALSKSNGPAINDGYHDAALQLDFQRHLVYLRKETVDLSPQEYRLLVCLVKNAGMVMTPDQLLSQCWKEGEGGFDSLRVYIGYLRKKLQDDPKRPELIETVREFGYRYCPPSV